MRPIFCGNVEYDARQSDLERLFRKYGRVERVDMKSDMFQGRNIADLMAETAEKMKKALIPLIYHETSTLDSCSLPSLSFSQGFAFVYMEDERDAEDAVRGLDQTKFGRKERRLRVEWTKHERGIRRPGGGGDSRRSSANTRPSRTLFVINFDPNNTRTKDLERHFETYGKIVSVRIRRNFAFVQFDSQDDATRALEASNMSKLMDRVISVEYAARDDDEHRNGHSPDRSRDRSRDRSPDRGRDRRRSPSPYRKDRDSPDYGHTSSRSPYRKEKGSSDHRRGRSPSPYKRDRASPESARGTIRSPYRTERAGSDRARDPVRSPYRKERASLENGRGPSRSPYRTERAGSDHARGPVRSPYRKERASLENGRGPSRSPRRREKHSAENDRSPSHSPYRRERPSSGNGRGASRSSHGRERERASPEDGHGPSPHSMPEGRDSPYGREVESPINERYRSRSPAGEK